MENAAEKIFTQLKDDLSAFAGLKLRLLKLMAIEKAAKLLSVFSHGILLITLAFFTILFLFTALGFFLGELLDSVALGFLIVGGIYLLLTLGFVWGKQMIRMQLTNILISALQDNDDDDDDKEDQSTDAARTIDSGEEGNPAAMPGIGNEN